MLEINTKRFRNVHVNMPSELYERFGTGTDSDLYRSFEPRAVLTWYFNSGYLRARTICFSHRNVASLVRNNKR